jgi:hypothetical protein
LLSPDWATRDSLVLSNRLATDAYVSLLQKTRCHYILGSPITSKSIVAIQSEYPVLLCITSLFQNGICTTYLLHLVHVIRAAWIAFRRRDAMLSSFIRQALLGSRNLSSRPTAPASTLGDVCRLATTVAAVDTASIYRLRCRRIVKEGSVSRSCNLSRIPPFSSDRLIEPEKLTRIAAKKENTFYPLDWRLDLAKRLAKSVYSAKRQF